MMMVSRIGKGMEVAESAAWCLKNPEMASAHYYLHKGCSYWTLGFAVENSSSFDEEAQQLY